MSISCPPPPGFVVWLQMINITRVKSGHSEEGVVTSSGFRDLLKRQHLGWTSRDVKVEGIPLKKKKNPCTEPWSWESVGQDAQGARSVITGNEKQIWQMDWVTVLWMPGGGIWRWSCKHWEHGKYLNRRVRVVELGATRSIWQTGCTKGSSLGNAVHLTLEQYGLELCRSMDSCFLIQYCKFFSLGCCIVRTPVYSMSREHT